MTETNQKDQMEKKQIRGRDLRTYFSSNSEQPEVDADRLSVSAVPSGVKLCGHLYIRFDLRFIWNH